MGNSNSSENSHSVHRDGTGSQNPQDGLKKSKLLELDSFSISCITCWLLGPEIVRLIFTGDFTLRQILYQGGVSEFRATPRLSLVDTNLNQFWVSLSVFTGLRRLKLEKHERGDIPITAKWHHLAKLPRSLRSLETNFLFDLADSEANKLPPNLENLEVLSCQKLILPSNIQFELPRTLQRLSCGYSSEFSRLVLPPELKCFDPHVQCDDALMELDQVVLPKYLEELTWPFFSALLWHEPTPITLKSICIHSTHLPYHILDGENAEPRSPWAYLPTSLTELKIGHLKDGWNVSIAQSLPRTLLTLIFKVPEFLRPMDKSIIEAMPPNLTRLECSTTHQREQFIVEPDAIDSLPRSITSLHLSQSLDVDVIISQFWTTRKVLNEKHLQALPPSLTTLRTQSTILNNVALLPSTLLKLECVLLPTQLPQLPPALTWLKCLVYEEAGGSKKPPTLQFPDSLTYLKTKILADVIQGVPKWPRYLQTLKCTFYGNTGSIWPDDWRSTLPKSLVRLELEGTMPISKELLVALSSGHKNLTRLRLANVFSHGSTMTLHASGLERLPRSLLHADVYVVDNLAVKHLRNLPRDLQYLSIFSLDDGLMEISNPHDFFKSLPKSLCLLRLPMRLSNSIVEAADNIGITVRSSNPEGEED